MSHRNNPHCARAMLKKAVEHRKRAMEHSTHAARHHKEAARHREAGQHEKAAHHTRVARQHGSHARDEFREDYIHLLGAAFRKLANRYHTAMVKKEIPKTFKEGDMIAGVDVPFVDRFLQILVEPDLTFDELLLIHSQGRRLESNINRLLNTLSAEDIDALFRVIEMVYSISRFMGDHPIKKKLSTLPAKQARTIQKERRRDIVASKALPIIGAHRTWTSNRIATEIRPLVNSLLKEARLPEVGQSQLRKDIEAVRQKLDVRS